MLILVWLDGTSPGVMVLSPFESSPAESSSRSATLAKMSDAEGAAPRKRPRVAYAQGPISPIAHPMASRALHKKIYKLVKGAGDAAALERGVKDVVKAIRKGNGGLVIIAGDIR